MSTIRWGCVQPLTGGMYLGTEKAVGHPAEWIISYPGLTDFIYNKQGDIIDAGNERNIVDYLVKVNRMPKYYTMNRTMTQNDEDYNPILTEVRFDGAERGAVPTDLYQGIDLVIGVPVCAGLSMASTASAERKNECNCQMEWMAHYVLNTIKPKVYLFENAPTLMSGRGDEVRTILENIATQHGYSIVYYKTDTKYHHNCQKRPRTFIFFFKNKENNKTFIPMLKFISNNVGVNDFFNEMKAEMKAKNISNDTDPMNCTIAGPLTVTYPLEFVKHYYGNNWRDNVSGDIFTCVLLNQNGERKAFFDWAKDNMSEKDYAWYEKYTKHFDDKRAQNKGIWAVTAKYFNNNSVPACMYKNVPVVIHYSEDRLYTMREWLWVMGHPVDFDMVGYPENYFRKMGQNVPVNTANWVASEAVRIIENWDNEENVCATSLDMFNGATDINVAFYDNTKQKRIY